MPTNLGAAEILVILVVALIVLGPKRLPEAGKQVGKALAEVRRWSRGIQTEIRDAFDVAEEPPMVSTDQVTARAATVEATAITSEGDGPERPGQSGRHGPELGPNASASRLPRTDSVEEVTAPTRPPRRPGSPEPPVASNGSAFSDDPPSH